MLLGTDGKSYFVKIGQRLFDGVITAIDAVDRDLPAGSDGSPVDREEPGRQEDSVSVRGGQVMRAKLAWALIVGADGPRRRAAPAEDRGPTTISEIRQESTDRSTRIVVECTGPVAYTYYSPDPLTLVVDIPEVDAVQGARRGSTSATREVESVRVSASMARADGRSLARLEVRLASLVPYQIYSKDKTLNLVFERRGRGRGGRSRRAGRRPPAPRPRPRPPAAAPAPAAGAGAGAAPAAGRAAPPRRPRSRPRRPVAAAASRLRILSVVRSRGGRPARRHGQGRRRAPVPGLLPRQPGPPGASTSRT